MTPDTKLDKFFIWLTGFRPNNKYQSATNPKDGMNHGIAIYPKVLWECCPMGNNVIFYLSDAPFFLHRWMQTIILGIRYHRKYVS